MHVQEKVSLKQYSTMRLGGTADYVTEVTKQSEIKDAAEWAKERNLPVRMIGGGSNIIWRDEGFRGLLVINRIKGFNEVAEDEDSITFEIGAGENWDEIVAQTAKMGLYGIECLSLIPGSVGATPVQNVGAYGQDISQVLVSLEAYDTAENQFVTFENKDCEFGYRTSRFKTRENGRYLIATVTLQLQKKAPTALWSSSLREYLTANNIAARDAVTIRNAIIAIREAKLPNPEKVANNGSFFANPIISTEKLEHLRIQYPNMPAWEIGENAQKLAAAWLIEASGFKGKLDAETGFSTWKNQALVIVNEKATSTNDLLKFQQKIVDAVKENFGITLEREPEILP